MGDKHVMGVIKRYADDFYSCTQFRYRPKTNTTPIVKAKRGEGSDRKIAANLIRTKTTIFDLSMCNDFELFVTFTISPEKYDRYNLKAYYDNFSNFINRYNLRNRTKIQYLLIPEMHKDGAWHMHGFFKGLPESHLTTFTLQDRIPLGIRWKIEKGERVYNWLPYMRRFGWCCMEFIRSREACSKYVLKYITKEIMQSSRELNCNLYYCSQGLKRPEVVYRGSFPDFIFNPDYENFWISRKEFCTMDGALNPEAPEWNFDRGRGQGKDAG